MPNRAIVATFGSENSALEAGNDIKALKDKDVGFSTKAAIVVHKDSLGNLSFPKGHERPLWGTLGGTVLGGLLGAIAGPAGAAGGAALGGLTGLATDSVGDAFDDDAVATISADLLPGTTAVIVDANEDSTRYVDEIVLAHNGQVRRVDL